MSKLTLNALREIHKIQGWEISGNENHDSYILGLYNGIELALSIVEKREAVFKEVPEAWLADTIE